MINDGNKGQEMDVDTVSRTGADLEITVVLVLVMKFTTKNPRTRRWLLRSLSQSARPRPPSVERFAGNPTMDGTQSMEVDWEREEPMEIEMASLLIMIFEFSPFRLIRI